MEHTFTLPQPWRTRAIVAAAVATLELVVLITAGIALLSKPVSQKVTQAAEAKVFAPAKPAPKKPKHKPPVDVAKLDRSETAVLVLNGGHTQGAAHDTAATVQSLGYKIGGVGNAPGGNFTRTLVMYRRGFKGEGIRLAHDLRIGVVGPLDGITPSDLQGAHVAVVLGG